MCVGQDLGKEVFSVESGRSLRIFLTFSTPIGSGAGRLGHGTESL